MERTDPSKSDPVGGDDNVSGAEARRRSREDLERRIRRGRMWDHVGEVVSYLMLFALSGAFVGAAYLYARHELSKPRTIPVRLQYASASDREMAARLEFADDGLPGKVAQKPSASRTLPYLRVADDSDILPPLPGGLTHFHETVVSGNGKPVDRRIDVTVPAGTKPGRYQGEVVFEGLPQKRRLKVALDVADPYAVVRMAGIQAGILLMAGYFFLVWMRPRPAGWLLMHAVTPYSHNRTPDPTQRTFRSGFIRSWIWLPGRNRLSLKTIDSALPRGEVVMSRIGLSRVQMNVVAFGSESEPLFRLNHWPTGIDYTHGARLDKTTVEFPKQKSGQPRVIALAPDIGGNGICFSFRHPDSKA